MTDVYGIIGAIAFLTFTLICGVAGIVIARHQKIKDDIDRGIRHNK